MSNYSFIMRFNNYQYRVSVGSSDGDVSARIVLLNRDYGLGNCFQFFTERNVFPGKTVLASTTDPSLSAPFYLVGLSDFTIQQSSQGGFRIDSQIDYYTTGVNSEEIDSEVVKTMDFGNYGSVCNFTDPWSGDFDVRQDERPKRKSKKNKNASGRCPSFQALARNFSGGLDSFEDQIPLTNEDAARFGTYYGFTADQPYYPYHGTRSWIEVEMIVVQVFAEDDLWAVIVGAGEDYKIFLAQRTGLVDSQISAQHLKHKETRSKTLFKQAQKSSGVFVSENGNVKKDSKIVPSSFQNDFKREKPRSWKKGTKNKSVNRKRARKLRKAAKKARVSVP